MKTLLLPFRTMPTLPGSFGIKALLAVSLLWGSAASGQTGIPVADGNFENGTNSFLDNGWTEVTPGENRQWRVNDNAGSVAGGIRSANVGGSANWNGANVAQVGHFYRDIVIPAGATGVSLSFYIRMTPADAIDFLRVYTTTTANVPVVNAIPGAGYTQRYEAVNVTFASFTAIAPIDLTSLAGTTVRLVFTNRANAATPSPIAVDNVTLNYTPPPCAGTPSAGSVPATITICPGGTTTINATGATGGAGISYQWEEFNGTTWVNAVGGSGANTTSYTTPALSFSRQYRLRVTCAGFGSVTGSMCTVNVAPSPACYCNGNNPGAGGTDDATGLTNVAFAGIANPSTGDPAYNNYTSQQAVVFREIQYPLSVRVNTAGNFTTNTKAWIDWDHDNVFEAVGEEYNLGTATNVSDAPPSLSPVNITVPLTALDGATIMRVRSTWSTTGIAVPCGGQNYTETEDYTVYVCAPPIVDVNVVDDCEDQEFSIEVDITSMGSGGPIATIEYSVNGGPVQTLSGLGIGPISPPLGPFAVGDEVVLSTSAGVTACSAQGAYVSSCAVLIDCDDPTLSVNYCYGNNDTRTFTYTTTSPGETLTLAFISGFIGPGDNVFFHDGTDDQGPLLPGGNPFTNTNLAGLQIVSSPSTGSIHIVVQSNGSGSCQDGQPSWNWDFDVECTAGCSDPDAIVTPVMNCVDYNFSLSVEILTAGDNGSTVLQYSVNGGAPETYPTPLLDGEFATIPNTGAFAMDDLVSVILLHGGDAACDHDEGTFTDDNSCPSAENCVNALNLASQTSPLPGTTVGRVNDVTNSGCGTNTAPDAIYYIDVEAGFELNIHQLTNNYNSQHYVRYGGTCPGANLIACVNDPEFDMVTWLNNTGSTQRVWWVQDGAAGASGTFTLEWTVGAPAIFPLGVCGQNLPIPDADCVDANFQITGQPNSLGTNVGLESVDIILTHTYRADMDVTLITPGGQELVLFMDDGGDNNNFGANGSCTVFKLKDGGAALSSIPATNNVTGTYQPEQLLSSLTGNPNGFWQLRLCDDAGADIGALRYLKLNFLPIDCNGVLGGPAMPGTPCNDMNACTTNDVYTGSAPSCGCAGTPLPDADGDGTCDAQDTCTDTDGDGFGNPGFPANTCTVDNCPSIANPGQANNDGDTEGDACDTDDDNDGVLDVSDNCPLTANPGQANNDGDTEGDACDTDDDNDGVLDVPDNCPLTANADQANNDGDTEGDVCDADDDNDTVLDAVDNCPLTANADQADNDGDDLGDVCDTDDDNDGIPDVDDSCPFVTGEQGDICDANPGSGFTLGQINASCVCEPAVCTINLTLEFDTDNGGDEITWELRQAGTGTLVQSGGGTYPDNALGVTDNTCLPNGSYYLRVIDSAGDGITNGGYVLRTAGSPGKRIIDNRRNFSDLPGGPPDISQVAGGLGFDVPMGTSQLIYTSCDKLDWVTGEYIVASADPLVSAEWSAVNGPNEANSGYEFWFFNPNGGYSFRKFRSHAVSDGFAPDNASRACHLKINNWAAAQQIPANVLMNVKLRTRIAGANGFWGPACRFKIDPVRAACPLTKLMDIPGNQYYSCGSMRAWGNGNYIHARSVSGATQYQFRFRIDAEGFVTIRTTTTYFIQLNWLTLPLQDGKTYTVEVRAFKGGAWCVDAPTPAPGPNFTAWGDVCLLTIDNTPMNGDENILLEEGPALSMYPNPNRGDQLFLGLDVIDQNVDKVSVDIFDATGKRMLGRIIPVNNGLTNTTLDLDAEMANGLYFVNITAGEQRYTERLVIQR